MSVLPSSSSFMAQAMTTGAANGHATETFNKFFECWLAEQDQNLQQLVTAARNQANLTEPNNDPVLTPLIQRVIHHYEQYYQAKSTWAKDHVLSMFSPTWRSSLEDAFLWIGGWRPSMAFHLLYSKSGLQLEARLSELIRGLRTYDLGDISPSQLRRIDELQRETVEKEKEVTEKFAKQQETVADRSMVELSSVVSEIMRNEGGGDHHGGDEVERERVEAALDPKKEGLAVVLQEADDLRLRTLKTLVLEVLTPIQAVHFLIAAAELHLRIHDWGKRVDVEGGGGGGGHHHPINGLHPH